MSSEKQEVPERIWLQLYGDDDRDAGPADYTSDEVTWCWHRINESDVEYVRYVRVSEQLPEPPDSLWLTDDGKMTWQLGYMAGQRSDLSHCECGDQFTLHDRGTCVNCLASRSSVIDSEELPQAELTDKELDEAWKTKIDVADEPWPPFRRELQRATIAADRKLRAQTEGLMEAQADRDYYRALIDGSWPSADECIANIRRRAQKKDKP